MNIDKNNLNKTSEIIQDIENTTQNTGYNRISSISSKTEIIEELAEAEVNQIKGNTASEFNKMINKKIKK